MNMKCRLQAATAILAGMGMLQGCASQAISSAGTGSALVFIGTHDKGRPMPGHAPTAADLQPGGKGIYAARFDEATGALTPIGLVAEVPRPTWLVSNPDRAVLYSVSEIGNDGKSEAQVYSLAIDSKTGGLTVMNHVASGGGGATHLALDSATHTLFVANFGDGKVGALPVRADGSLGAPSSVQADYGSGPKPRQQGPHAHAVAVDPFHRFVLAADLGADRVFTYRFDPTGQTLSPATPPFAALPPGTGPRHLAFLSNGRYVYLNTELGAEIVAFRWNGQSGAMQPIQTLSLLAPEYRGEKSAAEIAASHDDRFIYVSNRGEDTVVVFKVDPATGKLAEIQRVPAQGKTPWSFTIDPAGKWMIVANEASSSLSVMRIDPQTGMLTPVGAAMSVPKPVSIAFYPG